MKKKSWILRSIILLIVFTVPIFYYFKLNEMPNIEKTEIGVTVNGEYKETFPEKEKDIRIKDIICDNGAIGNWDEENWSLSVTNLATTRTKCYINFLKLPMPLEEFGIDEVVATEGDGLYEVPHENASITYTTNTTIIQNLKMTEYRYAGKNPNNYIWFNEELWRMIGLVNTPEGQRLKILRDTSIGKFSWDTCATSINSGYGVNEWSQSDIKNLLNRGPYYNRINGSCYNGLNNQTTSCSFNDTGLLSSFKDMIDTVTWNLGTNGSAGRDVTVVQSYNNERGKNTGKLCSSSSSPAHCNDTVIRNFSWQGEIGLMYPSDYGYATIGGPTKNRSTCLNTTWTSSWSGGNCPYYNWIFTGKDEWLMIPLSDISSANGASVIYQSGVISRPYTAYAYEIRPVLFLKQSVKIIDGSGTKDNPYILAIKN